MNKKVHSSVGLHMRVMTTLQDCLEQARTLQLPFFQCFFLHQPTASQIKISPEQARLFAKQVAQGFEPLFAHASYWINLASDPTSSGVGLLRFELEMAKRLGFKYVVLHPGSGSTPDAGQSIANIARKLNLLLKQEQEVVILLENTAFGNNSVGGKIEDLAAIRQELNHPEKVQFCIDTAHAYAYGYDLVQPEAREHFIQLLGMLLGFDAIQLIHLNDAGEAQGSKRDRHALFGQGTIGSQALSAFIKHADIYGKPCILELPMLAMDQQMAVLYQVQQLLNMR